MPKTIGLQIDPNSLVLDFCVGQASVELLGFFAGGDQADEGIDAALVQRPAQGGHQSLGDALVAVTLDDANPVEIRFHTAVRVAMEQCAVDPPHHLAVQIGQETEKRKTQDPQSRPSLRRCRLRRFPTLCKTLDTSAATYPNVPAF